MASIQLDNVPVGHTKPLRSLNPSVSVFVGKVMASIQLDNVPVGHTKSLYFCICR